MIYEEHDIFVDILPIDDQSLMNTFFFLLIFRRLSIFVSSLSARVRLAGDNEDRFDKLLLTS